MNVKITICILKGESEFNLVSFYRENSKSKHGSWHKSNFGQSGILFPPAAHLSFKIVRSDLLFF